MKNLETRVGQLALSMQNRSKDSFPSDKNKNLKDCMVVTLRSGRELEERRNEKKETKEEKHTEIGEELKQKVQKLLKKIEQQKYSKSSKLKREI